MVGHSYYIWNTMSWAMRLSDTPLTHYQNQEAQPAAPTSDSHESLPCVQMWTAVMWWFFFLLECGIPFLFALLFGSESHSQPKLAWNSLCDSSWHEAHRNPPASAWQVLGLLLLTKSWCCYCDLIQRKLVKVKGFPIQSHTECFPGSTWVTAPGALGSQLREYLGQVRNFRWYLLWDYGSLGNAFKAYSTAHSQNL